MTHTYDSALPAFLWIVQTDASWASLERACLVRDVRGRLRLVVEPAKAGSPDLESLARGIEREVGKWFAGPILSTASKRTDESRLARELLRQSKEWPGSWPTQGRSPSGANESIDTSRWTAIQKTISKDSWLAQEPASPPWPLVEGEPAIVSFSSFKGGVGRSTCLATVAWQLAHKGQKVVCIDLDLEAPGLGPLLGAAGDPSVLDFLLTSIATGSSPREDPATRVSVRGESILVVAAGQVGSGYLEKLARLDFLASGTGFELRRSPVEDALRELLALVRRLHSPDYIFLDCRAGVSDIGGLSINDLPHVDVVVGRAGRQWDEGLGLILQVMKQRRKETDRRLVVVQSFVPLPLDDRFSTELQQSYRQTVHGLFSQWLWSDEASDIAAVDDSSSSHYPAVIGRYDELAAADALASVSETVLDNDAFRELRTRIEAAAEREGREVPPGGADSGNPV